MTMADVLIAGGGLAGSALAIQLGRLGITVEMFERGSFPREKPCGEGLMPAGVAALGRLGLDPIPEGEPFWGIRYHFGKHLAEGRFPRMANIPLTGLGCRRRDLDRAMFLAAAKTPGVTASTGARVERLALENGRVIGLLIGGELRRGRIVVAADGAQSRIRHSMGLDVPARRKRVGMRAHFRLAPGRPHSGWVDVYLGNGFELYVTPLRQGELLVAVLAYAEAFKGTITGQFRDWCNLDPELSRRLEGAEQISDLQFISPLSGRARRRFVPGLVLLGDAAGFSDPLTGGGMTQALLAAEMLANGAKSGLERADLWLEEFDRKRQKLLRDYRRVTAAALRMAGHPTLMRNTIEVLHRWPGLFSHLLGIIGGMRHWWGGAVKTQFRPQGPLLGAETAGQAGPGNV